ncbi:hypothetical protein LCGC14_1214980 [marine sediment metagenome]|uniref:HTH cro/C1-type domain-containing protein n=1 Tax=marine sediment metagenome TaxID=412755 RepID=A0A0F9PHN1_9ZZZZ
MTERRGRPRIHGVMTPYARLLSNHIDGRSVVDVARAWGVPRWVLDDGLRQESKSPSARYLSKVAKGLGLSVEELLDKIAPQEVPTT